jgi:type IV pilus assembly protein PilM
MAKRKSGVWGIDIGQCALKALRCTLDDDGKTVVAEAYDFIEYPKILSQPEANAEELVRDAVKQFLSRNEIEGDKIAISVSGQAGLARFFKPPPVDAKVIPDIVKYEARQQIPFALEDVIWDYQQMGGMVVDGITLDAEVGLFAMKRDQVFRAIEPFTESEVELHIVQLAPLSIFNFVVYDVLQVPEDQDFDPDNPPESLVVLSMGTETTDLVITNGSRVWQRSIPLGGNHFTKQLTKELKLTYAKAEHLKRNAREAEDPKKVFQVMRPVFSDLVTEIQRSVGYFRNIDRQAKVGRLLVLGNGAKLPGLEQYLAKHLNQTAVEIKSFARLKGGAVASAPAFRDNLLAFPVCYGLCMQGLGVAKLHTNLLPPEFLTERMIREKKPWAVAALGVFLLALAFNAIFYFGGAFDVNPKRISGSGENRTTWEEARQMVASVDTTSKTYLDTFEAQQQRLEVYRSIGEEVVGNVDRKRSWLELLAAIDAAQPRDPRYEAGTIPDPMEVPFKDRMDLYIESVESEYYPDLSVWFTEDVKKKLVEEQTRLRALEEQAAAPSAAPADGSSEVPPTSGTGTTAPAAPLGNAAAATNPPGVGAAGTQGPVAGEIPGPTGAGWVIEIRGHHFHNGDPRIEGGTAGTYVRNTLVRQLRKGQVLLPTEPGADPILFDMEELGIGYVVLTYESKLDRGYRIDNPAYVGEAQQSGFSGDKEKEPPKAENNVEDDIPASFEAPRCDFVVQFCWQETTMSERLKKREQAAPQNAPGGQSVALQPK